MGLIRPLWPPNGSGSGRICYAGWNWPVARPGPAALQNSATLLERTSGPRHQAASRFLRGEILQTLGHMAEALRCYTNNLAAERAP